jgi:hypothetical protein
MLFEAASRWFQQLDVVSGIKTGDSDDLNEPLIAAKHKTPGEVIKTD